MSYYICIISCIFVWQRIGKELAMNGSIAIYSKQRENQKIKKCLINNLNRFFQHSIRSKKQCRKNISVIRKPVVQKFNILGSKIQSVVRGNTKDYRELNKNHFNILAMKGKFLGFLQLIIIFVGVAVFAMLMRLPLLEGRAKNLSLIDIYLDPLILYGYAASIAFFVALYNLFRWIGTIRQDRLFSAQAIRYLNLVQCYAIILSVMIVVAAVYVKMFHAENDDPAGFLAICIVTSVASIGVAIASALLKKKLTKKVYLSQ